MHRLLLALLGLSLSAPAFAQSNVPAYISYQGKITDAAGVPIGNTTPVNRKVIFRIWDHLSATTAGNRLYSEQQTVTVSGGEFSVLIGAGTPVAGETTNAFTADIFAGPTRYLGVTVDDGDENLANDPESSPRQQMVSTAFALRAQIAETVAAGSITSASLAPGAVGTAALGNNTVTTAILGNNTVTDIKLATGAVTTAALGNGTVTDVKLAAGAVTTAALGNATVTGIKIADGAISLGKLGGNSVDSSKIVDGSVATADLVDGAVTDVKIGTGAVIEGKIAAGAVTTAALRDSNITLTKLAANSVDTTKIVDGTITRADLSVSVQNQLPKDRDIYNQGISNTVDSAGPTLIPIELGDLGLDDDGCRIRIFALHKTDTGADSSLVTEMQLFLQQPGWMSSSTENANSPWVSTTGGQTYTWLIVQNLRGEAGIQQVRARLPGPSTSVAAFTSSNVSDWIKFYNFHPGSLRTGDTNHLNNPGVAQGAAHELAIKSIDSSVAGQLTLTFTNPHSLFTEVTQLSTATTVTLLDSGGNTTAAFTGLPVIQRLSSTSVVIGLNGASGPYNFAKLRYIPQFSRYRIWAAVHQNVSARIIVSDR